MQIHAYSALGGLGFLLCLAACSDNSGAQSWFPLQEGKTFRYAVEQTLGEQSSRTEWVLRNSGPLALRVAGLAQEQETWVRHHSEGVSFYLQSDANGIRRIASRADIDRHPTMDAQAQWVLKAPLTLGNSWSTPTRPHLLERKNEYPRQLKYQHQSTMHWHIAAVDERVQTPAGTFSPCLRVEGEAELRLYTDPVNGFSAVPLLSKEWYCRDVGLVRFERVEKVPAGFLLGGKIEAELIELP